MVLTDVLLGGVAFISVAVFIGASMVFLTMERYEDPRKRLRSRLIALIALEALLLILVRGGFALDNPFMVDATILAAACVLLLIYHTIEAIRVIPRPPRVQAPPPSILQADDNDEYLTSLNIPKPEYKPRSSDNSGE